MCPFPFLSLHSIRNVDAVAGTVAAVGGLRGEETVILIIMGLP